MKELTLGSNKAQMCAHDRPWGQVSEWLDESVDMS